MENRSSKIIFATFILSLGFFCFVFPVNQVKAGSPTEVVFSDDFESTLSNWTASTTGSVFVLSSAQTHAGSKSLLINQADSIYHKIAVTDINSPNRALTFWWYPTETTGATSFPIFSLEEGAWESTSTDKSIEMFWDGNQVYFSLYRYADAIRSSSTSSVAVSVSNNDWHKIEIYSSTTATVIEIDDTPLQFNGQNNSAVLTNVYNWLRFNNLLDTNIHDDDDYKDASVGYS